MTNNKAFSLITGLVVVVGALGHNPALPSLRTSQEVTAKLAAIFLVSFFVMRSWWLKLFLAYCAVMVYVKLSPQSLVTLHTMFILFVMFQALADNTNKQRVDLVLNAICWVGIIQGAMMLLQYWGVWWMIFPQSHRSHLTFFDNTPFGVRVYFDEGIREFRTNITGFTSNPNMASGLIAMCIPAFMRRNWIWWGIIPLCALFANHCLQGKVAFAVVMVMFALLKIKSKWKYWVVLAMLAVAGVLLYVTGEWKTFLRYDRIGVWTYCITDIIPRHPFVGYGLGMGQYLWAAISKGMGLKEAFTHPHNEFIFQVIETGWIGFSLIMGYLTLSLYTFCRDLKGNKLIIFLGLVSCLFNCAVSFPAHVTIGIVMLAYISLMQYFNQTEVVRC